MLVAVIIVTVITIQRRRIPRIIRTTTVLRQVISNSRIVFGTTATIRGQCQSMRDCVFIVFVSIAVILVLVEADVKVLILLTETSLSEDTHCIGC